MVFSYDGWQRRRAMTASWRRRYAPAPGPISWIPAKIGSFVPLEKLHAPPYQPPDGSSHRRREGERRLHAVWNAGCAQCRRLAVGDAVSLGDATYVLSRSNRLAQPQ